MQVLPLWFSSLWYRLHFSEMHHFADKHEKEQEKEKDKEKVSFGSNYGSLGFYECEYDGLSMSSTW